MTEETLFAELIKHLKPFDRKLIFALNGLRDKQGSMTIRTSRFELCRLVRLPYDDRNAAKVFRSLERLKQTPLFLPGPAAGFALATKVIGDTRQEKDSEKLTIELGNLFSL